MLNHISLHVDNFEAEKNFFRSALAPLGFETILERPGAIGLGIQGKPELWVKSDGARGKTHFAFTASSREAVNAFHKAALLAGGTDNGTPGVRERPYVTNYAAFVLDPEGNNIEVIAE